MNDRLSFLQIIILVSYAVAMAAGQILFKLAALQRGNTNCSPIERLVGFVYNAYFGAAVIVYAALAVVWVWILTFTPLSRAYAFVALALVLTPLAGGVFFGEPISIRLVFGIGLVVVGLVCIAG
jgi:drug/metabolite transporter (DMT)-like permease